MGVSVDEDGRVDGNIWNWNSILKCPKKKKFIAVKRQIWRLFGTCKLPLTSSAPSAWPLDILDREDVVIVDKICELRGFGNAIVVPYLS